MSVIDHIAVNVSKTRPLGLVTARRQVMHFTTAGARRAEISGIVQQLSIIAMSLSTLMPSSAELAFKTVNKPGLNEVLASALSVIHSFRPRTTNWHCAEHSTETAQLKHVNGFDV